MSIDGVQLPPMEVLKQHVLVALAGYWKDNDKLLAGLSVQQVSQVVVSGPLRLQAVALPDWAASCGVDGCLLVPKEACPTGFGWQSVDWWLGAFLLLECWHERVWEACHGPIHSYSYRLDDWDARVWERAWVNRIAMFLREWSARLHFRRADDLFGPLPMAEVVMSHDVDAVAKTVAIRIKQGGFHLFNVARHLLKGQWREAETRLQSAFRLLLGSDDWWCFVDMQEVEERAGMRSTFHFSADPRRKTPLRWLLDPGYDVRQQRIQALIAGLVRGGWRVGLHQSYDAWQSSDLMRQQRSLLQSVSPESILACRQHWLRFSWQRTWDAQCASGLLLDTTLMFNDRMGFRTAAALCWSPWNHVAGHRYALSAMPTVLMDSHVFDYRPMTTAQRMSAFSYWLDEIRSVGGSAAVLWHPHTVSADYGWRQGFVDLVTLMVKDANCANH